MLFALISFMFGWWTALRTLDDGEKNHIICARTKHLLIVLVFHSEIAVFFLARAHDLIFLILILAPFLIAKLVVFVVSELRKKKFKDNFCHYLDLLTLQMRSGNGFRAANKIIISGFDPFFRQKVTNVFEMLSISDRKTSADAFLKRVLHEFEQIDKNPHNSLQRINNFRKRLRVESEFRRRSGQASTQARTQAVILLVLYLATLAFSLGMNSFHTIWRELFASMVLFGAGTIWIFRLGRSFRWKT